MVVETATGKVRSTLVDFGDFPENGTQEDQSSWPYIDGVTITPDGRTAYYSVGPEPAVGILFRVAVTGGAPEEIGNGSYPRVSPDGRFLA